MKRSLLTLSLLALSAPVFAGGPELQPLREIAIQDGGRTKPLDSFARELARRVQGARAFGFETIAGLEPTEWLLATLAAPERWKAEPIVKVTHAGLRQAAGLPATRTATASRSWPSTRALGAIGHDDLAARVPTDHGRVLHIVDRRAGHGHESQGRHDAHLAVLRARGGRKLPSILEMRGRGVNARAWCDRSQWAISLY